MKIDVLVGMLYQPKRADAYLAEALAGKFSREEIKAALVKGAITLNGRSARPSAAVKEGDRLEGEVSTERGKPLVGEAIPVKIVHEDASVLVVDKPAGMVVHPGAGNKKGTLVHALIGRGVALSEGGGDDRPGIVHRIDKDTSGLLVVAKTNEAHRKLQAQFESRSVEKTYVALVRGHVAYDEGRVTAALGRDPKSRVKRAVSRATGAKEAETRYRVLERFRGHTLLELRILTGRTHQIRVHMAHLGHAVAGDALYGPRGPQGRMALHAAKLEFDHPKTGKRLRFESEWPEDFKAMVEKAREAK